MKALAGKLILAGQTSWDTPTRLSCLLLMLGHIHHAIKNTKDGRAKGVLFSSRLARQYCSKLRTAPSGVAREPLAALCLAGLIEQLSPAKKDQFSKRSARYRLTPEGNRVLKALKDCTLANGAQRKQKAAPERLENGLNRHWPFRAQLLRDLAKMTLASSQMARDAVDSLLASKDTKPSTRAVVHAIATREHTARVQPSGQITTSLNSCPKLLKLHLCIAGEAVALCDISSAHWAFLPRLVSDRIEYCRRRGDDQNRLAPLNAELHRLIELCGSGSFYHTTLWEGATADDIKSRKKLLNILLNSPRSKAENNRVWQSLRRKFPLCVSIIDSIKRDDHRSISRQLQHFTAVAITRALIEMQAEGLPAIPDTDCLIVRECDKAAACLAIGRSMFKETRGVCVTVGGVRYSPPIQENAKCVRSS